MTDTGEQPIFFDAAQLYFFPVRHHSPACAWQLRRAMREIQPSRVLIEAPVGFEPFIPLLADARTQPPVAIVAMGQTALRGLSYYPLCAHSPEYIAIRDGLSLGAEIGFIDLPALHPAMIGRRDEASESQPISLVREHRLDSSAYVRALCERTGTRDGAALWDNLFEAQIAAQDWRRYFASVALYCAHIRAATPAEEMQTDGTTAREAQMAACIAAARADARGPILVVTGGFHTPALVEAMERRTATTLVTAESGARAYLVRYGFQQLNRLNGYSAGLPLPGYYDRVWSTLESAEAGLGTLAADLILAFADHLRTHEPSLRLPVPAMRSAIELAHRLAELRGLPHPGRCELLDAIQSTCIKDAIDFSLSPIGNAFASFLCGFRIGDVSPDAGLPPIVEAARNRARGLSFVLEDGVPRTRELDLHRKARHREASHFLHAMDMLGARFAHRESGPDPLVTHRAQVMIERWRYAWSPIVEARLIECATDGDTVELACAAVLHRRRLELIKNGQGANAAAAAELLLSAYQAGLADHVGAIAGWVEEAIAADIDLQSLTRCLLVVAGMDGAQGEVPGLVNACYRRILFVLPDLRTAPDTLIRPLTTAIAELAQLLGDTDNRPVGLDIDLFRERVGEVLEARLPGPLDGAMSAVAGMFDVLDIAAIEARTRAALAGAYETPAERIGVIAGLLAVAPHFFLNSDALLSAADAFVAGLSDDEFLALLPEFRLAFTGLNPEEVDRFSAWLAKVYGIDKRAASEGGSVPDAELVENMRLSVRLEARWRKDGLAAWMGLP